MIARIEPEMLLILRTAPHHCYDAIVRTADNQTEAVVEQLAAEEFVTIHRVFRLLPGLAVTAPGDTLLALADCPGVVAIDPDGEIVAAERPATPLLLAEPADEPRRQDPPHPA